VFQARQCVKISTADLIEALIVDTERPWATYNQGKPISPRQLAKHLAAYGIKSKTVRLGYAETPKGYERSQFDDAFERYLGDQPQVPQQRNDDPQPSCGMELRVADVADPDPTGEDPIY
jgi:putative DNA primase/helicase